MTLAQLAEPFLTLKPSQGSYRELGPVGVAAQSRIQVQLVALATPWMPISWNRSPASDGADNFVWISSPCEGFWFSVVFDDEAIDCFLQVDDRYEDSAL
jgi:hypothetical protein